MNVVVVGGGTPGKFGNDFVNRMRSEGHDVYILSHKDNGTNDPKQLVANFRNYDEIIEKFKSISEKLSNIDILVYNTNTGGYPGNKDDFTSSAVVNVTAWQDTFLGQTIIPHGLSIEALKNMTEGSKIVFMTTGMAMNYTRTDLTQYVGYASGKAGQTQLMLGLANLNDKGAIVTAIAPYFNYDNPEVYQGTLNRACNYIMNLSKDQNGKIEYIN